MRLKSILAAMAFLGGPLAASPASQAHATGYTFTDINVPGSQPGSTGFLFPLGINNLGQVAGSYFDNAGNSNGFLYSGGKYVTIDAPGATDTYVSGINDRGQILGMSFYARTGKSYVFLDTHGTFTNIADANAFSPISLNDRDQVLVYAGNSTVGVLNAHGVFTPIDTSGAGGGFVSNRTCAL
jgi:hypothetical protein